MVAGVCEALLESSVARLTWRDVQLLSYRNHLLPTHRLGNWLPSLCRSLGSCKLNSWLHPTPPSCPDRSGRPGAPVWAGHRDDFRGAVGAGGLRPGAGQDGGGRDLHAGLPGTHQGAAAVRGAWVRVHTWTACWVRREARGLQAQIAASCSWARVKRSRTAAFHHLPDWLKAFPILPAFSPISQWRAARRLRTAVGARAGEGAGH